MKIAGILLAAGASRRFGPADKLAAQLGGLPLAEHAANVLRTLDLSARFAITHDEATRFADFAMLLNAHPEQGMARSIRLGVEAAETTGADAVLIALADMPFITTAHLHHLMAYADSPDAIVTSQGTAGAQPPAIFGKAWFAELRALHGDRGARGLLGRATRVAAPDDELMDIDEPGALLVAEHYLQALR